MSCDTAQGYLMSRPVPPEQLRERIAQLSGLVTAQA
jgi:EAL domain-containing protein (putative c-di-GMP-specific phosphodiesterase class I)